ncbi:hypothetical protein DPX16_22117 [Anabarilius grahami]|uniref:Uncharacterized protein n=1 Tax=Anabarilius grahami TaxID=495550 RepID=A0A3N0XNC3_ANAGA|nr:hypothetical protein DPX16_22117 [Anabarilius grahami]
MDVVSAVVRCAEGFGKPEVLSVIRIFFSLFFRLNVINSLSKVSSLNMDIYPLRPRALKTPQCANFGPLNHRLSSHTTSSSRWLLLRLEQTQHGAVRACAMGRGYI